MLLRTAAFKKSHLDFGNEDSEIAKNCVSIVIQNAFCVIYKFEFERWYVNKKLLYTN